MLLNIFFLFFLNTYGYSWIFVDIKKLCGNPHNKYPTDIGTGTGQIFIQSIGYEGATTYTLPVPLTSLVTNI